MPLSTYQNDSTCDLGAPLRPYSEKLPTRQPSKAVAAGSFRVSAVGEGERNGVANVFFMKTGSAFMGLMKEKRIRAFGCEKKGRMLSSLRHFRNALCLSVRFFSL